MIRPAARIPALVLFAAVAVLTLHGAAPVALPPGLWGFRTWDGIPFGWRACLVVVGLSLFTAAAAAVFDREWSRPPLRRTGVVLGLVVMAALFWVFRSHTRWGNDDIAVGDALRGRLTLKHMLASGTSAAIRFLLGSWNESFEASTAVAFQAILAGLLSIWGAFALGHALFPRSLVKARVVALTLMTSGFAQEFFGVLENYAIANATQIWTLVWIVRLARPRAEGGSDSPVPVLTACSLSTITFVATVFLWPAALYAILRERARVLVPPFWKVGASLLTVALLFLVAAGVLHVLATTRVGYQWDLMLNSFGGMDNSAFVPLTKTPGSRDFFTLFSWEHLAARVNAVSLAAPAWLLVLAGCLRRRTAEADPLARRWTRTLGLAALGALSMLILVHPDLGPTLDWMQTAIPCVAPLTFVMAWSLSRVNDADAARLGTLWVGISLLHTVPWILANAAAVPTLS